MFKKLILIASLVLASLSGSMSAMAQQGPPAFDRSNQFGLTEVVPGIFLNANQKATLIEHGCLIGPTALVARILERVGNTCDKQMFGKLAHVHKSGSSMWMLTVVPDGLELMRSVKGVNVSQNSIEMLVYPFKVYDHPYAGKPMRAAQSFNVNGAALKGQAAVGILTGMFNGTGAATIAAATNPCNRAGGCGGTWNIMGGTAAASAGAVSQQQMDNNIVTGVTVNGAAPCGGSCQPAVQPPHPGGGKG